MCVHRFVPLALANDPKPAQGGSPIDTRKMTIYHLSGETAVPHGLFRSLSFTLRLISPLRFGPERAASTMVPIPIGKCVSLLATTAIVRTNLR